eukprot:maker-scaffold_12-snap-gene-11.19-mRNA-1 protein AED:0.00 eAED:0.00 QI:35/1/1/1/1/1/2/23/432
MLIPKVTVDVNDNKKHFEELQKYAVLGPIALELSIQDGFNMKEISLYLKDYLFAFDCIISLNGGQQPQEKVVELVAELLNAGALFVYINIADDKLLYMLGEEIPETGHQRIFLPTSATGEFSPGGRVESLSSEDRINRLEIPFVSKNTYRIYDIQVSAPLEEDELKNMVRVGHRESEPEKHDTPIHIFYPILFLTSELYAKSFVSCLKPSTENRTLWPTIVADELNEAIGLVYSSEESIVHAVSTGWATYFSRSRNKLWVKGESSGNKQKLLKISFDCDADALKFNVKPDEVKNKFCHQGTYSCFSNFGNFGNLEDNFGVNGLFRLLKERQRSAPEGSYTARLFSDKKLLQNKILEEGQELIEAFDESPHRVESEFGDLLYFGLVACCLGKGELTGVIRELDQRHLKIKRRPGNSKQHRIEAAKQILEGGSK